MKTLKKIWGDTRGAGLLEYLIVAAFVGIAAAVIIGVKLKTGGGNVIDTSKDQLSGQVGKWKDE